MIKAFQVCARDLFVPEDQQDDAFNDKPLRLDREFNISAPRALLSPLDCTSQCRSFRESMMLLGLQHALAGCILSFFDMHLVYFVRTA